MRYFLFLALFCALAASTACFSSNRNEEGQHKTFYWLDSRSTRSLPRHGEDGGPFRHDGAIDGGRSARSAWNQFSSGSLAKRTATEKVSEKTSVNSVHISMPPPKVVQARQHGKTILECTAEGSPIPRIQWFKHGVPVRKVGERPLIGYGDATEESTGMVTSKLTLDCVGEQDAAIYECVADNLVGDTAKVATSLQVSSYPSEACVPGDKSSQVMLSPEIIEWQTFYMNMLGTEGHLFCRADRADKIEWFDNMGKRIDLVGNSDKFKMLDNGDLVISPLTWEDMGEFNCVAYNMHGADTKKIFVYPFAPADQE